MTIKEVIKNTILELKKEQIEEAYLKVRLILADILHLTKEQLFLQDSKSLTQEEQQEFTEKIEQLKQGKPLQYILHHQEFMKLDFYVDENVLIPRADTENLVEEVLELCKTDSSKTYHILDLCTGSGAIAISLAHYLPKSKIIASDISEQALMVAKRNVMSNQVEHNIELVTSDVFSRIKGKFDFIVSNPPYIPKEVIPTLQKQVKHEPYLALEGGEDGLDYYRKIIEQADEFLTTEGYLCLEIGYDQKESVLNLVKETKKYSSMYAKQDLSGNDRIVIAKR